jgi:hypothetical protein
VHGCGHVPPAPLLYLHLLRLRPSHVPAILALADVAVAQELQARNVSESAACVKGEGGVAATAAGGNGAMEGRGAGEAAEAGLARLAQGRAAEAADALAQRVACVVGLPAGEALLLAAIVLLQRRCAAAGCGEVEGAGGGDGVAGALRRVAAEAGARWWGAGETRRARVVLGRRATRVRGDSDYVESGWGGRVGPDGMAGGGACGGAGDDGGYDSDAGVEWARGVVRQAQMAAWPGDAWSRASSGTGAMRDHTYPIRVYPSPTVTYRSDT